MTTVIERSGLRLLLVEDDDPIIRDLRGVTDLVGESLSQDTDVVVVPVDRLDPAFFELRSGFAGEMLQKLANYRRRLAVLGDISASIEASGAFRDLVREADRGTSALFCADLAALDERLAASSTMT